MKIFIFFFVFFTTSLSYSKFTYHHPSQIKIKIDGEILAFCMAREISHYERPKINPSTIYRCNKKWALKMAKKPEEAITFAIFDKTFLDSYLQINSKRVCDYETGDEDKLKQWVMNQPENSIDHIQIFRESLRLSNGKVYDAILTIHQLLRNEARYWSTKYYAYDSNPQHEEEFWNKFVDMRGELPERGEGFKADHAGSWYRMWGMMLNRIASTREAIPDEKECGEDIWAIDRGIANIWNDVVAIGAEAVKPVLNATGSYKSGGDLLGKTQVNLAANTAASHLDAYFSGKKFTSTKFQNINCDRSPHIIFSP